LERGQNSRGAKLREIKAELKKEKIKNTELSNKMLTELTKKV
jgi:hypothetical protein